MAEYTKVFDNPYPNGWEDLPSENTPITASALQEHTDAIESIEDYLADNPIESGTTDYSDLTNKPQINGHTLSGNMTTSQIGITVPTSLSDLTDDATHRVVTDTEKSTWNGKSTVSWNQIQASGTKIAEVTIDGTKTDIYSENGGGGVSFTVGNELDMTSADVLNFKANYGTTSEFNTFKQDTSVPDGATYHVTDDYVDGSGQQIYDGTERVIGTWFGKPLYRKCLQGNLSVNETSTNLGLTNAIDIKNFCGYFSTTTQNRVYNGYSSDRAYFNLHYNASDNKYLLYHPTQSSSATYNICIEYTKVGD